MKYWEEQYQLVKKPKKYLKGAKKVLCFFLPF